MQTNEDLVGYLQSKGVLTTHRIIEAFRDVDRKEFVAHAEHSYQDIPLPIGFDQTISQPYTVAFMLEQLQPRPTEDVLDVGSGSGYTTALLAHIVGVQGKVIGVEKVPELVDFGWRNVEGMFAEQAEIHQATSELGWPDGAPYDRILVSAAAQEIPQALLEQLKPGGVMVIPVQDTLVRIVKRSESDFDIEEFPGFRFVPLV